MALVKEYTNEQLNYFRICYVTTDILAEGLREIFKQEWGKLYKPTKGEWRNTPHNGMDFYNGESVRNKKRNAHLLVTMKNGNIGEWDCTMLFYAILFSDCLGPFLGTTVRKNVDVLRKFRNEDFAHIRQSSLSDISFQNAISKVHGAFQALGLPALKIQLVKNQKTFPTEELQNILKEVDDLKQELQEKEDQLQEKEGQRQVLEDQLQKEAPSFCILPPKPSHDIEGRDREVAEIIQQLKELKESSNNRLSYLYISGNPGSGKSQLASLVAKRFFKEVREMPGASSFVMTLNAASISSLLESYASFARQLKCPDYSVTETLTSKDLKNEDKIANLKTLIAAKINFYGSWLLVVDNVTTLPSVHVHLPQSGHEAWAKGQLLITTQDTESIPLKSSFINHISVSKGMEPHDASSLLAQLSGITDGELGNKVANKLDYQPLALAAAAVFVKEILQDRKSSHFGWEEYLKILDKGKRETTEDTLAKTNLVYPSTMTKAITLALEKLVTSDKFFKHLFTLISLCAPQPLNMNIVVSYIMRVDELADEEDKDFIRMRIRRCSVLLFEEEFIRVHQIVYAAIKTLLSGCPESQNLEAVNGFVTSLNEFIVNISPDRTQDTIHLVPHLKALLTVTDNLSSKTDMSLLEKFKNFGGICRTHGEFKEAKTYFEHQLTIKLRVLGSNHVEIATCYEDLSLIHLDLGDFKQAKEYKERALTIRLEKLGAEHVDVATSYSILAEIHQGLGEFEQAKEYQERALAIRLEKIGTEHVDVATSFSSFASIHQNLGNFVQAKEYIEFALSIYLKTLDAKDVMIARSYCHLASIHHDLGDLEQAKEYQQQALTIYLEKFGTEHVEVATSYNILANIHRDLGAFEQARECEQLALTMYIDKLGAEHIYVATSYNNLASINRDLHDFEQAKKCQQRALSIYLKRLGEKHVHVATSYTILGTIHRELSDFEQAMECQQHALTINLEKLGAEHVEVGTGYNNLALIHLHFGDFDQAKECQHRALTIYLKKLGAEHVSVARSYSTLAAIHRNLCDFEQAKECQQRALNIYLKKLGTEHVEVATNYSLLASIQRDLGDLNQAKECQQRALTIFLEKRGAKHVDVAKSYNNLAIIDEKLGDLEQAKECQQRALQIFLEKLGAEHVDVATSYCNLARIHGNIGDFDQAKECQQRAQTIYLKKHGLEHVDVARSYSTLATIHQAVGDFEQAKECQQRALTIYLKKLDSKHVEVATNFNNFAFIHQDLGDFEQAKECQQRALTIFLEKFGAEHTHVAESYENLASIHRKLGNFKQAVECKQRAMTIYLKKLWTEHAD